MKKKKKINRKKIKRKASKTRIKVGKKSKITPEEPVNPNYINPVDVLSPKQMTILTSYLEHLSPKKVHEETNIPYKTVLNILGSPIVKKHLREHFNEKYQHFRRLNVENAFLAVEVLRNTLQVGSLEEKEHIDRYGNKHRLKTWKPPPIEAAKLAMKSSGFYTPKFVQKTSTATKSGQDDKSVLKQIETDLAEIKRKELGKK